MIGSILYAMLVIYVIVCIVLWGLLLHAAGQGGAGAGFAIIFMMFVPFWPIALPGYVSSSLSEWYNRPARINMQPVALTNMQPVVDAAKTKEAADAAVREKTVAVVTDAKAAAAAPVVDMTAVAK